MEDPDTAPTLQSLPSDVLLAITAHLLPSNLLAGPWDAWRACLQWAAACQCSSESVALAVQQSVPALRHEAAYRISAVLSGLVACGQGRWLQCQPLRAVRPTTATRIPLQRPPQLSGASLCTLSPNRLCIFGGRASASADTLNSTYVVAVSWPTPRKAIAVWDELVIDADQRPPPRCYHTAAMWHTASTQRMAIFGGAGEGETMFNDIWGLDSTTLKWSAIDVVGGSPAPRSSHLCVAWPASGALIVHGGLGCDGVTGDVWVLRHLAAGGWDLRGDEESGAGGEKPCWELLETDGESVKRAHHCGGLGGRHGTQLLAYSGQDDRLLTVHNVAVLDLETATWTLAALPSGRTDAVGPAATLPLARIDAGAAALPGVGVVVFGGVADDFSFVPAANAWLLRSGEEVPPLPVASSGSDGGRSGHSAPGERACMGLCGDGLRAYVYGGFDGENDLDELHCLSLLPEGAVVAPLLSAADGHAVADRGAVAAAARHAASWPGRSPSEMAEAIETAEEIKARRAMRATVLHATPAAAGHNFRPGTLHARVMMAGMTADGLW